MNKPINAVIQIPPPPTHQAALRILKSKDGRQFIGKMSKSSAKKWNEAATLLMRQAYKGPGFDRAVRVSIVFAYPHTKESWRVCKRTGYPFALKMTRPDLDNLAKSVLDCMVDAGWLKDDNLIVELTLSKRHEGNGYLGIDIVEHSMQNSDPLP